MERASNKAYVSKRVLSKYKKEKERISEQQVIGGGGGLGSISEDVQMENLESGIFDSSAFKGAKTEVKASAKFALHQEAEDSDDSCESMSSDELNDNLEDDLGMPQQQMQLGSIQQQDHYQQP